MPPRFAPINKSPVIHVCNIFVCVVTIRYTPLTVVRPTNVYESPNFAFVGNANI
jgi:hypothetical protein